jgi:hypothetical protein
MRRESSRARPVRRGRRPARSVGCAAEPLERRALLSTVAYWRFEDLEADQEFAPPVFPSGPGSGLAADEAGGDDALRTYSDLSNPTYRANVPAATVTATGEPNNTSLEFTPNEDLYTNLPGSLNAHAFPQFTVEASFRADVITWQNIVGKDGKPTPLAIAPLQLKIRDDTDKLQIEIIDSTSQERQVQSIDPIVTGRWYHAAAVSDGETLSLYLDDTTVEGGYVLQGTAAISGGLLQSDATWAVGRGFYNNNVVDWFDGHIDEVRISDTALSPSEFLFAAPGNPVAEVFVRGSTWLGRDDNPATVTFMEHLAANELGDDRYGYRLFGAGRTPPESNPEDILPWINADQLVVRYAAAPDAGGVPTPESLSVRSFKTGTDGYTVTSVEPVAEDPTAFVITLNKPLGGGNPVTGVAPTADENGDMITLGVPGGGPAGGDFALEMLVLQGDTDHLNETRDSHAVLARDYAEVKRRFFTDSDDVPTGGDTDYSPFHDVDGSGNILARDYAEVKKRFFQTLPPPGAEAGALQLSRRATRDVLG